MSNFQKSYISQKNNIENKKSGINTLEDCLFTFKNRDCFLSRMQRRPLGYALTPFLVNTNNWLTIGDYAGVEANYLKENHQNSTASDLSDAILSEVAKQGFISNYTVVNVEHIKFEDNSYDYVFCKEAFHHFPRAYLGLYEMIRVADKAAILLEPIDILSKMPLLMFIKNILDRINPTYINKIWKNRFSFETVGNYVFKISEREVEKIAMGIGLPCIAFKGINVFFTHKEVRGGKDVPTNKKLWNKVIFRLKILDLLCFLSLIPHNTLCNIIFKKMPDDFLVQRLKADGYKVIFLPKNPYL
jgi:Methyltransferase domain